ncbi:MAG: hypothetical protein VW268_06575 [Rhodospirillaceae bacterium]
MLTACSIIWAAGTTRAQFVGGIEDLPLMPGLTEDAGAGVVFETTSGRIVEAVAAGPATRAQVLEFYDATLPQLGWQRIKSGQYRREGETLILEFPGAGAGTAVRFRLTPQG